VGRVLGVSHAIAFVQKNEVRHANILTDVYAIASLGLQVQVCQ